MKFMSRFRFMGAWAPGSKIAPDYSGCKAESNRRGGESLESFAARP
jgi:hypothetical protein